MSVNADGFHAVCMSTSEEDRHQARPRPRLFVALTLPDLTRRGLEAWQRTEIAGRHGVRPVAAPQLHITLAFLGNRPAADIEPIAAVVRSGAAGVRMPLLEAVRYRETRHVGMVTLRELAAGGERSSAATEFANGLMHALASLGVYRLENRPWLPHITVARFETRPGLAPASPDLPLFTPSEVVLYESKTGPGGSVYTALESVALRTQVGD